MQQTRAETVFTGEVSVDFTSPDTVFIADPGGVGDVTIGSGPTAGWVSGWA